MMKSIQPLLAFGLAALLSFQAHAQTIETGTRFLMFNFGMGPQPDNVSAHIDSLFVSKESQDTIEFEVSGIFFSKERKSRFLKINQSVWLIRTLDTLLLYDYSLTTGDTFKFKNVSAPNGAYLFLVDSVRLRMFENGKYFRHWYLRVKDNAGSYHLIWIENLGEKFLGWNYENFRKSDGLSSIYAICDNSQLIYWSPVNYFPFRNPAPVCNFDSLVELLSVEKLIHKMYSLSPNPSSDIIHISGTFVGCYQISDIYGKTIKQGKLENEIIITDLKSGVYFVQLLDLQSNHYETHKIIVQR